MKQGISNNNVKRKICLSNSILNMETVKKIKNSNSAGLGSINTNPDKKTYNERYKRTLFSNFTLLLVNEILE